ncbi:MAG: Lon-like protease helical domain-containing protein, partial [Candidatus Binataceae bacterium]
MTDSTNSSAPPSDLKPAAAATELTAAELRGALSLDSAALLRAAEAGAGTELLGQERALDAIRLAIGIDGPGYNVYVSGLRSRPERESVVKILREKAASMPTPGDWVYVHNFRNPEAPTAIYLRAGQGVELRERLNDLIDFIIDQLPKAFRREDFDRERSALRDKYNRRAQELFGNFETRARERGFAIQNTPTGQVLFIPLIDGKMPESPEALAAEMSKKSDAEREQLARAQAELQEELAKLLMRQQELMREMVDDIRAIERSFAARLITPSIEELKGRFDNPEVTHYLDGLATHLLSHLDRFREQQDQQGPSSGGVEHPRWFEYQVNVMVDNSGTQGAPVVTEDAPTYRNLFGSIERWIDPLGRT